MAFIRAVQFRDVVPVSELIARVDRMLAGTPIDAIPVADFVPPQPRQQAVAVPALQPERSTAALAAIELEPPPDAASSQPKLPLSPEQTAVLTPVEPSRDMPVQIPNSPHPKAPELSEQRESIPLPLPTTAATEPSETPAPISTPPEVTKKRIRQNWDAFLKYVRERQPWVSAALQMANSVDRKGDDLIIHFTDSADCTLLKQRNTINALTEFVLDFFQENLRIQFEVPGSTACSIDPANGLAPLQERRALSNDPLVLTALDVFTGQVGEIRVGQRYRTSTSTPVGSTGKEEQPAIEE